MELIEDDIDFAEYMREEEFRIQVKPMNFWRDAMREKLNPTKESLGSVLPWRKTHNDFRFRESEVTLWQGINGHGKSLLLGHVGLRFMLDGKRIGIASMEMKPESTLARMCRQFVATEKPGEQYQDKFLSWTTGKGFIYNQIGSVNAEKLLAVMRYCSHRLKINHFVIDSLMKCGIGEDDYNRQKQFVDRICTFARDSGCHVHLVAHSRKGQDEFSPPNKMDVKGSGSIVDQVDNLLTVWRNKKKELIVEEANASGKGLTDDIVNSPDALLICDKQRNGEWEGRYGLWFDPKSLQYLGSPDANVQNFWREVE